MSDSSQGPGWWQASDGRWYPPQEPADTPTTQQPPTYEQPPGGGIGTGTVAITPPSQSSAPRPGPPPGPPPGQPPQPAPGGTAYPPTSAGSGYTAGGGAGYPPGGPPGATPQWSPGTGPAPGQAGGSTKIALAVGIGVLVLVLVGAGLFLVLRPKENPVAMDPTGTNQTTTTGAQGSSTTKKKTTTTEEDPGEETTTSRRSTNSTRTRPSLPKTTTTMKSSSGGAVSDQDFADATAQYLPKASADERVRIGKQFCSDIAGSSVAKVVSDAEDKFTDKEQLVAVLKFVYVSIIAYCPQHRATFETIFDMDS